MKIKLSQEEIERIVAHPERAMEAGVKAKDPWWVIVLKVIAYVIGLLLGGTLSTSAASYMMSYAEDYDDRAALRRSQT